MTLAKEQSSAAVADLGSLDIEIEFAKKLAGNDKANRDRAMRNLWRWFRSQSGSGKLFSHKEFMVLWKGLYYTMWMSDKPKVQEELADKIVSFTSCFESEPTNLLRFLDAYFQTMAREYFRIDRFRIDKFLMLLRRMINGSFKWLRSHRWEAGLLGNLCDVLRKHVLSGDNAICQEGLQNFVTEVILVEIQKLLTEEDADVASDLTPLFIVFCNVLQSSKTPFLRRVVMKNLFEDLKKYPEISKVIRYGDIGAYALDQGKLPECPVKNRRVLYEVHNMMLRFENNQPVPMDVQPAD